MALTKIGRLVDKGIIKDQTNLGTQAADTDEYLLYDADTDSLKSIAASNVTPNETLITGKTDLSTDIASGDLILVYDASLGTLKKISQTNFLNFPTVSSVSPTNAISGDGTGNYTFVITGIGFTGASADLINNSGTAVAFDTVTVDSNTQITGVIAKSSLPNSGEPYDVRVTAASGLRGTLDNQITIDANPVWSTASGSLASVSDSARASFSAITAAAADPESGGDITYTLETGTLPAGLSGTSTSSGYVISGTPSAVGSNTTSNFTIRAKDVNSNTADRAFSITVLAPAYQSFTSSGTFSVPSGVTAVDVLVVAGAGGGAGGGSGGGGGGAGGLIFRPGFPVTPGGTVSVTVGCGGAGSTVANQDNNPGSSGQDSVFGTITAKGGGGGGSINQAGLPGGSGGGNGRDKPGAGGSATQPTQPGDSGTYGFGNSGGSGVGVSYTSGSGGGGAGAAGQNAAPNDNPVFASPEGTRGTGGIGRAYTIADGTTSVYYAGGGGGSVLLTPSPGNVPKGGNGGGGNGGAGNGNPGLVLGQPGTANRGGGGGGTRGTPDAQGFAGGQGGKGIVIVAY